MPERLGADKKQKIASAHADLLTALQERGVHLSEVEANRLRKKLSAYIGKTNPEVIDIPTMRDAIVEKISASPEGRLRWFQKAGLLHTLEEHARENTRRASELRRSLTETTDWTPVSNEATTIDGRYYLGQLVTEAHLKQESAFLEHCLGAGSLDYYLPRLRRGEIEIFSVRDSQTHEPVVTIEYDVKSKSIQQVKGKNNEPLTPESPHLKPTVELLAFLKNHSVHHDRIDPKTRTPLRREVRAIADLEQLVRKNSLLLATGEIIETMNPVAAELKASDVLTGNFSIERPTPAEIIASIAALPVNVDAREATPEQISRLQVVGGNLYLYGTKIAKLPENLRVGGYLDVRYTDIPAFPNNLTVGGFLNLYGTKIAKLPDNLTVGGYLDVRYTDITALPNNLTVGGDLDLRNTPITKMPDNLTVGGSLDLRGTNITALPNNLTVGGFLNLRDTKITKLPENLRVGGYLNLAVTNITALPDNLTVGGFLNLYGTKIAKLPDNLTVGGSLDLRGTNITTLPENLRVSGDLNLAVTNIKAIPDNLRVGGDLYLNDTAIKELSPSVRARIQGRVYGVESV